VGNNRVTVAMPVYNGMPHVTAAVESVLNQTYEQLELVIIDDGSGDGTGDYLRALDDPRIVLSPNPENLGVEGAWNRALDQAERSPYWKLLCADDLLYPHCIATEVAALDAHPEAAMTASRRTMIDDEGNTLVKARGLAGMSGLVDGPAAVRRSIACGTNVLGEPSSVLVRSSAAKAAGRFSAAHKYCIDFDMWARVLQQGKLYAVRDPLSAFRVGALSDSLATAQHHRTMVVGEFRKLVETQPGLAIDRPTLYAGMAMAAGLAAARKGFYAWLDVRKRLQPSR
jgi:glycosyltransferase involved in cell wall biosynthesis